MGTQPAGDGRAKGKGNRETWRDWLPAGTAAGELLTREQILERLRRWRVEATEADLRYWEYEGILPRPVRRSHEGAVRAIYPAWFVPLVRELRHLQRSGLSLSEIAPRLRIHVRLMLAHDGDDPATRELRRFTGPRARTPEDIHLPPELLAGGEGELFDQIIGQYRESLYPETVNIDVAACERVVNALTVSGALTGPVDLGVLLDTAVVPA